MSSISLHNVTSVEIDKTTVGEERGTRNGLARHHWRHINIFHDGHMTQVSLHANDADSLRVKTKGETDG